MACVLLNNLTFHHIVVQVSVLHALAPSSLFTDSLFNTPSGQENTMKSATALGVHATQVTSIAPESRKTTSLVAAPSQNKTDAAASMLAAVIAVQSKAVENVNGYMPSIPRPQAPLLIATAVVAPHQTQHHQHQHGQIVAESKPAQKLPVIASIPFDILAIMSDYLLNLYYAYSYLIVELNLCYPNV